MKRIEKLKVCSLFSGIGGFETGVFDAFGKENVDIVFASEIDKFASKSYQILYGHQPHGDIRKIHEKDVPNHDLLVGGFPCQAFSNSGLRLGFSDARGTLFFEIARIAKEKKPKVLFLENVKGLVNHDKGKTLQVILKILSDLDYCVDFKIINSKFFHVPQSRERIYIIAIQSKFVDKEEWNISKKLNTETKAKKKMMEDGEISTFNFDFPEKLHIEFQINDILENEVEEKYYLSEIKTKKLIENLEERHKGIMEKFLIDDQGRLNKKLKPLYISPTLRREMHGNEPRVVEPVLEMVGLLDIKGLESIRRVYSVNGLAPTLTTMGGGNTEPKIAIPNEINGEIRYRIRKLTPLECFRLQHFPDDYYYQLRKHGLSDTQLYKMAGNAVTTSVISVLAKKIETFLEQRGDRL